jgi:hypothetical protein
VRGEVIGLAQDRTEVALTSLLTERLDARQRAAVEAVCTDMHRPYRNTVGAVLPRAEVVFAGGVRLLTRHLLPAASGYIVTQATLLFPAFILAEATMSFVGLGFPMDVATWGTMLQEAANVTTLGDAPWALAPAFAIFAAVLGVNLVVQGSGRAPVQLEP